MQACASSQLLVKRCGQEQVVLAGSEYLSMWDTCRMSIGAQPLVGGKQEVCCSEQNRSSPSQMNGSCLTPTRCKAFVSLIGKVNTMQGLRKLDVSAIAWSGTAFEMLYAPKLVGTECSVF